VINRQYTLVFNNKLIFSFIFNNSIVFLITIMSHRKTKRTFVKESKAKSSSRKHVICNCNLCKGAKVDPRTRESHMKKREVEVVRGLSGQTDRPSEIGKWKSDFCEFSR
jgi:hypothetical protein